MTWDEVGEMLRKKNQRLPKEEPTTCVCGHSKYHHNYVTGTERDPYWDMCSVCKECPGYEQLIFKPPL